MTGRVSDGPTSYAVLQQVPGANLEHILTDFIKERLRCKHLGGSGGHAPPPAKFLDFLLPKAPSFLGFGVIQTGQEQVFNLEFFSI